MTLNENGQNKKSLRPNGRRAKNSGAILMLACFCMPVLIGLMGLAIDASVLYSVKTKLQMSTDGAALAGLRSMSLAQTVSSQTTAVTNVATQWFNANYAGNFMASSGTTAPTVVIGNTAGLVSVRVSASTQAPSYFMKLWNRGATTIAASGTAARQNVVMMLVLDRSGSMDPAGTNLSSSSCGLMRTAAKQFTGMFTPGVDSIGLITFAETAQIVSEPTTDFQTTLGYTNSGGNAVGAIDNITCLGGTNTPTAVSLGWNELYKKQLPGALNTIMVFTDGNPTAGAFNFKSVMKSTSGCKDSNGTAISAGGNMAAHPRNWIVYNQEGNVNTNVITLGTNSYFADLSGPIGGLYGDASSLYGVSHFFVPAGNSTTNFDTPWDSSHPNTPGFPKTTTEALGCTFAGQYGNPTVDINSVPSQDLFGISTSGYTSSNSNMNTGNVQNIVINLADNAANFARQSHVYTNGVTMPGITVNVIGLGTVNATLLQRMANVAFTGYTPVAGQPRGKYIYSPTSAGLSTAFQNMASSTLRLAQ